MNVGKCVALHNQIFKYGWLGSGRTIEDFEQECKPWFDLWGDEAEALRNTLSPNLVAFLERTFVTNVDHSSSTTSVALTIRPGSLTQPNASASAILRTTEHDT
jgi:hypothetical protein